MLGATTTSDTKIRLSEQSINTVPALRATGRKTGGNEGMRLDSKRGGNFSEPSGRVPAPGC